MLFRSLPVLKKATFVTFENSFLEKKNALKAFDSRKFVQTRLRVLHRRIRNTKREVNYRDPKCKYMKKRKKDLYRRTLPPPSIMIKNIEIVLNSYDILIDGIYGTYDTCKAVSRIFSGGVYQKKL